MNENVEKLKQLIEASENILVTSHISPDPDAATSLLLLSSTLRLNFPDKTTTPVLEDQPAKLDFIQDYQTIKFQPITQALSELKPELFILLDGNNYSRASRHDAEEVKRYILDNHLKTAVIDHHEPDGKEDVDVYINQGSPACAADVYDICFKQLDLKMPEAAVETAMTGLYADSGGFTYLKDGNFAKTFDLVHELIDKGANIERTKNQLNQFNEDDIKILSTLLANTKSENDYSYSFLGDDFMDQWLAGGKTYPQLQLGTNTFLNEYIRNINGRQWGFIVYKNKLQGENIYSVSLRSVGGVKDVAELAVKLGGGGHKPAAGGKFEAVNLEVAINTVKQTISAG